MIETNELIKFIDQLLDAYCLFKHKSIDLFDGENLILYTKGKYDALEDIKNTLIEVQSIHKGGK